MSAVYEGQGPPYQYVLNLDPEDDTINFTLVTSAVFVVRKSNGDRVEWAATISNKTTTTIRLTYVLAIDDLQIDGPFVIYARLNLTGGGFLKSDPRVWAVRDEFDTSPVS